LTSSLPFSCRSAPASKKTLVEVTKNHRHHGDARSVLQVHHRTDRLDHFATIEVTAGGILMGGESTNQPTDWNTKTLQIQFKNPCKNLPS
jgi:hypothetical protein